LKREKRRGKRPGTEDLEISQKGSSIGSLPQPRQESPARVQGYKPRVREITYPLCRHCMKNHLG
ncbi:hypothetical protein HAX54_034907, partial [Datura stramonium]|nr:hypothetical protein [Datura stramonium]